MFMYMFITSMIVLIILLAFARIRIAVNNKPKSSIVINSENLANAKEQRGLIVFYTSSNLLQHIMII